MEASRKEDEERALAFAALSLVRGTIDVLEQKQLLQEDDIHAIFERALTSLEFRAQDGAIGLARRIVEGIAVSRAAGAPGSEGAED
jgi:hypothetical protein